MFGLYTVGYMVLLREIKTNGRFARLFFYFQSTDILLNIPAEVPVMEALHLRGFRQLFRLCSETVSLYAVRIRIRLRVRDPTSDMHQSFFLILVK